MTEGHHYTTDYTQECQPIDGTTSRTILRHFKNFTVRDHASFTSASLEALKRKFRSKTANFLWRLSTRMWHKMTASLHSQPNPSTRPTTRILLLVRTTSSTKSTSESAHCETIFRTTADGLGLYSLTLPPDHLYAVKYVYRWADSHIPTLLFSVGFDPSTTCEKRDSSSKARRVREIPVMMCRYFIWISSPKCSSHLTDRKLFLPLR